MDILFWIGLGLFAGGLASRFLDDTVPDTLIDILLGVVGSVFSGFLLTELGNKQSSINIFQIFTILLSAAVFIGVRNSIKTTK